MTFLSSLETAIFRPRRRIGPIVAQVTFDENARDDSDITRHPVEQGAEISDHVINKPAQLIIRAGWSNSGAQPAANALANIYNFFTSGEIGSFDYCQQIYNQLLALKKSRIPFDIVTGKRKYSNMLIKTISQATDEKSEHSLFCTLFCEEVLIVSTTVVPLPSRGVQQYAETTAADENQGVLQLSPGPYFDYQAQRID